MNVRLGIVLIASGSGSSLHVDSTHHCGVVICRTCRDKAPDLGSKSYSRRDVPWLELLLVLAIILLLWQLAPSIASRLLPLVDARRWSRATWLVVNALVILVILAIQYRNASVSVEGVRQRRAKGCDRKLSAREVTKRKADEIEERKLYKRMQEARKRQVL